MKKFYHWPANIPIMQLKWNMSPTAILKIASLTVVTVGILLLSYTTASSQDNSGDLIKHNQYDLSGSGKNFLLREAKGSSFFMLGELHGERDIPELINSIWPEMEKYGYHHIAAEISPWTANNLEFVTGRDTIKKEGLWSRKEAKFVHQPQATSQSPTIWGCDMEEIAVNLLIKRLFAINPHDATLSKLSYNIKNGYDRKMSPELLDILKNYKPIHDVDYGQISLFAIIMASLKIDSARAFPESKLKAQLMREELMKEYFLKHYRSSSGKYPKKVFFRFGRNHLHRGFDNRGISTMGNFVSEFAIAEHVKSFNVAAFAAGGKITLMGVTDDADERDDDLAFKYLSEQARYDATIFDLRPLRIMLHGINADKQTDVQKRLLFWADSYDAIIYYKKVTPYYH